MNHVAEATVLSQSYCVVRTSNCTPEDLDILKSRVITIDSPNYPTPVLHVHRLNEYMSVYTIW